LVAEVSVAVFALVDVAAPSAKLFVHHIITEVSDVPHHACDAQTALWHHTVFVEMTAMKIGVGHDGAACHFVEGNVLSRQVGRTGYHHRMAHTVGVLQRPAQGLHAPQAAAHHRSELLNAELIEQARLRIDPIFHGDHREVGAVHLARVGVGVHGSG
jgi:hypothetical protein